jgi:D-alanyl-D-alanine carboxypeptidase (penicillin-binding protein 5/6)
MAEQAVSKAVYMRRRLTVAVAAILLLGGGVVAATQIGGDPDTDADGATQTIVTDATTTDATNPATAGDVAVTDPSTDPATGVSDPTGTDQIETGSSTTAPASSDPAPVVDAAAYAIYDTSSKTWLAESEADTQVPVGSVMKLLTAYVVMQNGDLTKVVTVPDLQMDPLESAIGLFAGEQLPRDVLLRAMLIVSANDAARALAVDVGGSQEAFVSKMNAAAGQLGLTNTVAANPVGLDSSEAHSSARDMVVLAELLMRDQSFRATVVRTSANLHGQSFATTNDLLASYPGADGVKTGHTTDAGWCLVGSATRDGRQIIVAVMGSSTEAARVTAATSLLDWAFDQT